VQLTEREYYATQPLQTERAPRGIRRSAAIERAPQGVLGALARVIRVEASLAVLTPASVAALLAWWQTGRLDVPALVLTLCGLLVSAWGLASWAEYADYLVSQRSPGVRSVPDMGASAYAMMERGVLAPSTVRDTGLIQLAIGALCTLWLTVLVGWPPLFFNGLSFLLAAIAIWGPLRYGFAGWGLGDLVLWLAVGVLPALTSYYVQAQTIGWLPVWAGIAFGLLAALHYLNRSTVHYRRDWRIHKRTLTVNLGLTRALDVSALLTIAAHVAILLMVVFMDLPLLALMALGALPVALGAFAPMNRDQPTPHQCRRIYWTGLHATMLAGLLFGLALVLDRMV
jgi:1,4-dihydroxy-2-naphthoate octaprenyltransferase